MRSIKIIKLEEGMMGNELVIVIFPSSSTSLPLKDLFVRPCA